MSLLGMPKDGMVEKCLVTGQTVRTVTLQDLSGARDDGHLVELWLAQRPESTRKVYGPVAKEFLKQVSVDPLAPGSLLRELDAAQLIAWSEELIGEPSTRARKVSTIKSLLSFAWRTGYCVHNVGRVLRCCKVPHKIAEKILEESELRALIAAAPKGRDCIFLRLLYTSGARISELTTLRWVDLRQPGRVTVLGKGQKRRTVVIPEPLRADIMTLRVPSATDQDAVFCSLRDPDRGLNSREGREIVYRARRRAKMDRKVSPHWLRHSHGTAAIERGCPLHVIQHSLGHANISTTSIYLHVRGNQGSGNFVPEV